MNPRADKGIVNSQRLRNGNFRRGRTDNRQHHRHDYRAVNNFIDTETKTANHVRRNAFCRNPYERTAHRIQKRIGSKPHKVDFRALPCIRPYFIGNGHDEFFKHSAKIAPFPRLGKPKRVIAEIAVRFYRRKERPNEQQHHRKGV